MTTRVGYRYQAIPSDPDNIDGLRTFLMGNLQTWGVSQTFNFDSGISERNYLVLSQGSREVLLYVPKGTGNNSLLNNGARSGWYKTSSQVSPSTNSDNARGPFAIGYSPTGGYGDGFDNGFDPSNHEAFWEGTSSCWMANILLWCVAESREIDLYFIENLEYPELIVYYGLPEEGYGIWVFSSQMTVYDYIPPPPPEMGFATDGVYRLDVTLGTSVPRPRWYPLFVRWRDNYGVTEQFERSPLARHLSWLGNEIQPQPETGLYDTSLMVPEGNPFNGHINPSLMREFPGAVTKTGGRLIRGQDPNDIFIHLVEGILFPWAPNLPSPYDP